MNSQAVPLNPQLESRREGKATAPAVVETIRQLAGICGLADATTRVGKIVGTVDKSLTAAATKSSGFLTKLGFRKLAAFCLKVAAASPVLAKVIVGVAIVAVAVTVFNVVRPA